VKPIMLGAAVLNQTPLDWDGNRARILSALSEARDRGVQILCLPELCITGYGCEDAFHSGGVLDLAARILQEVRAESRGMIVAVGLPVLHQNALFNAACLIADGELLGFVPKRHLAGDGLHYEPRWFRPWPAGERDELVLEGRRYPIGDLLFDCGGVKIGFEICEDAWVAQRPGGALSRLGVDVILNPSASHFAFGKSDIRRRFVLEGSRAFGVSYVYANLLGNEAGRAIYDGGALIASGGTLLAAGPRLGFEEVHLTTAVVDVHATRLRQARTASYNPELTVDAVGCVRGTWAPRTTAWRPETPSLAEWERGPHAKHEEFTRAIALALFDYLRKCRARGFVVSLSGGADSTAVAALCALMVELGTRALGAEAFAARLPGRPEPGPELVSKLLTCLYQPTRNSSEATLNSARSIAAALGARFHVVDVDALVEGYVGLGEAALGRPLRWETDDVTLQNIQARARAPSAWLLANALNALLLATSNRSEAAVGYATMDGDTCGGLSPIGGIDKAYLREWLRWLEHEGPDGHAIPALSAVNQLAPTAELRPPEEGQTDEGDLMPYPVLDAIERAAIRDKLSPREVLEVVSLAFPQHSRTVMLSWVERFFRLWCRNQWKRERYAPAFHVDDESLDPKTWCRFPILSGGFQRELEDLKRTEQGELCSEQEH
jgi:NAD+ synthase (glutamine-hydrolysing)